MKYFFYSIFFCLLILTFSSCGFFSGWGSSHILYQKKGLSRDYTYIQFESDTDPFEMETQVGGEHIKIIKIIGFEGNKFLIEFKDISGNLKFHTQGAGTEFRTITPFSGTIFIRDAEAIAGIEMYAHPSADYKVIITRL